MPLNLTNGCGFVGSHGPDRLVEAGMKLADAASVSTSVNGCGAPRRSLSGIVVHAQAIITKAGSASAADRKSWAIYSVLWCCVQGVVRYLAGRAEVMRWLAARLRRSQLLAAAQALTSAAANEPRWSAASDGLLQVNPQPAVAAPQNQEGLAARPGPGVTCLGCPTRDCCSSQEQS